MNQNSFVIKGWAVTVVSALIALSVQQSNESVAQVAVLPVAVFWFLDAFYLSRERQFRRLYTHVAGLGENAVSFSMDTSTFRRWVDIPLAVFSRAVWPCYFLAIIAVFLATHAASQSRHVIWQESVCQRYVI